MKTPTELFAALADIAPNVSIEVVWSRDPDAEWSADPDLDPDDYVAWQSKVTAQAIINGKLIKGNTYLGGTWEEFDNHPSESNPDISGYLPQMIGDALKELDTAVRPEIQGQIALARAFIKTEMHERYEEQRAARSAS